jgi:CO dehydrogenase nickel-insertion accessory protein CooC1
MTKKISICGKGGSGKSTFLSGLKGDALMHGRAMEQAGEILDTLLTANVKYL